MTGLEIVNQKGPNIHRSRSEKVLDRPMTDSEGRKIAAEMATEIEAIEFLDDDIKAYRKENNRQRDGHEAELRELKSQIQGGTVSERVEVEKTIDYGEGIVTEIRLDTGEVINSRGLLPDERQAGLDYGE